MLCSKCQTEARNGKVDKGVFVCDKCNAASKRSAFENQIKEKFQQVSKELSRMQGISGMVSNSLYNLKEYLKENGINVD
jgi:ribosomal protein L37AE/L43A